jgi:hypothetical protein
MQNQVRVPELPGKSRFALERWFHRLSVSGLLFNPDDRPESIISNDTGEQLFSAAECRILNESLDRLFEHHGDTVREVALKYFYKATGIKPDYTTV